MKARHTRAVRMDIAINWRVYGEVSVPVGPGNARFDGPVNKISEACWRSSLYLRILRDLPPDEALAEDQKQFKSDLTRMKKCFDAYSKLGSSIMKSNQKAVLMEILKIHRSLPNSNPFSKDMLGYDYWKSSLQNQIQVLTELKK